MITKMRYEELIERIHGILSTINEAVLEKSTARFTDEFWEEIFSLSGDIKYELQRVIWQPKEKAKNYTCDADGFRVYKEEK